MTRNFGVQSGVVTEVSLDEYAATHGISNIVNVREHGALGDGTTDDTAAIQAAATDAAGGTLYIPAGTFKITDKITLLPNTVVMGAGMNATTLQQVTANKDGLYGVDSRYVGIRDLQVLGTGAGTGVGIHFADSDVAAIIVALTSVYVKSFGGDGVYAGDPIASVFDNVRVDTCGGHGFNVQTGTSLTFNSCYGAGNTQAAFNLANVAYSTLNSCASDSNGMAYLVDNCTGLTMNSCGFEAPAANTAPYDGRGFKLTGGYGHVLNGCYANGARTQALWITGTCTRNVINGFVETNPNSATAAIQVDSGSRAAVVTYRSVTANSFATGSVTVFSDPNGNTGIGAEAASGNQVEVHTGGTLNQFVARRESSATDSASFVLSHAGTAQWAAQMRADSTSDLHLRNTAQGLTAILAENRATAPNIQLLSGTKSFGGGVGVVGVTDATTAPTTNPTGGGVLYSQSGLPKWRDTAGRVYALGGGSTLNVQSYGAVGDGTTDDTTAIQAAINAAHTLGAGRVYFPASSGPYRHTGLTVYSGLALVGDSLSAVGGYGSEIKMLANTAHSIYGADITSLTIRDMNISGAADGLSLGSYDGVYLDQTGSTATQNVAIENVIINGFSRHGFHAEDLITSTLSNVRSQTCGGYGFFIDTGTSVSMTACYANSCLTGGYNLANVAYSNLNSCACDTTAGISYLVDTCKAVSLTSCGTEANTGAAAFKVTGGTSNSLYNCYVNNHNAIGLWCTGTSLRTGIFNFREISPGGSATASIKVDAASTASAMQYTIVTAVSFAANTTRYWEGGDLYFTNGGTTAIHADRSLNTNFANFILARAGVDRWAIGNRSDSTDDLHIYDANQGRTVMLFETAGTGSNISLTTSTKSYGGGKGVVFLPDAVTVPTTNPTGGGVLYSEGGVLKFRTSAGTINALLTAGAASGAATLDSSSTLTRSQLPLMANVKNNLLAARYRVIPEIGATQSGAMTADRAYAIPFVLESSASLADFGIDCTAVATGGNVRAGLYLGSAGRPNTLITDYGQQAAPTGGVAMMWWTATDALTAGVLYFAVVVAQGLTGSPTFRQRNTNTAMVDLGNTRPTTLSGSLCSMASDTGFSGALPGTFGTVSTFVASPCVVLKI